MARKSLTVGRATTVRVVDVGRERGGQLRLWGRKGGDGDKREV